ncbi:MULTISPECIES: LacI family DNA-binding transcriptional regulator [unclassified Streptomyces]|uniref:LacI family DNA-binding transcriptional regulator n=1 Tax=unclassified Streptomyces TaxID=2593676 RepID=UPI000DC7B707|nr:MULTISPECIES: LacI family DNA-binding transcriptional regulator [unclassified Streptomyces]AWZ03951.1 LacI family transcriptional regulator [Streptomyces sp. ICC4]AWZ11463.1 LacI family transcriptional regulator [Streptomyces sp. ICC1]
MGRRPTIADVARRAGVSRSSVSFAFNGRPGLAVETKARILAAADELGWTPSRAARALSLGKAGALGLVLTREPGHIGADPFFPAFIAGVGSVLAERGDALVLRLTTAEEERGVYEGLAAGRRVDGVLLTDLRQDDPRPALVAELGLPAVVVGRPEWAEGLCAVELDDRPAFVAAVRRLAALGHRRIAHVEGPQEFRHAQSRRAAWAHTLHELGLPEGPLRPGGFTAEGGAGATRELLALDEPPTAIVYGNDLAATAGLAVAQELSVAVPERLSVVGYDDTPLAQYTNPPLASARSDAQGWGAAAARALETVIADGGAADVRLPPAGFVPRGSLGPAPHV